MSITAAKTDALQIGGQISARLDSGGCVGLFRVETSPTSGTGERIREVSVSYSSPRREATQAGVGTQAAAETVSRHLRRALEQLERVAAADAEDVLSKDDAAQDALQYWALAFRHRKNVNKGAREFLAYLFSCMSSPVLLTEPSALSELAAVLAVFTGNIRGTTEKDVEGWLDRLEAAGFDLGEPVSEPLPEEVIARMAGRDAGSE